MAFRDDQLLVEFFMTMQESIVEGIDIYETDQFFFDFLDSFLLLLKQLIMFAFIAFMDLVELYRPLFISQFYFLRKYHAFIAKIIFDDHSLIGRGHVYLFLDTV